MNVRQLMEWLWNPPLSAPRSTVLIRSMAGGVFLWEGVLKFVYVNQGVGRFTKLGFPFPELTAHFVGGLEIVGGLLLIAGLLTRVTAIPFVIEMLVAILSTKITLYLGTSPSRVAAGSPTDRHLGGAARGSFGVRQLMSVLFLLAVGPGPWSVDALIARARVRALVPVPRRKAAAA
jgi:putative oxidoreductase